jgi:hypothetical protein
LCGANNPDARLGTKSLEAKPELNLGFDNDLKSSGAGRMRESLVGVYNTVELEAMGNQNLRVKLVRNQNVKEHWSADRVDQTRGDGNVTIPKVFQVERHLRPMHSDIGDRAARGDNILAQLEGGCPPLRWRCQPRFGQLSA